MGSMIPPLRQGRRIRATAWRICGTLAFVAGLVGPGGFGLARASVAASSPAIVSVRVGDIAPAFNLPALSGEPYSLSKVLGKKPVLLVFWSYFCFPCQREMPAIDEFYREMGPDNLAVIGICLDGPEYAERVVPFVKQKGITFPVVYDNETSDFFEVAERYGVVGTPTSFLLDLQGRVRLIHLGRLEKEALAGALRSARDQSYCPEITKPTPPPNR